ncbi:MAG: hypothetical protein ACRDOB_11250, partial [Streptosporangiaceae bacterium]
VGEQVSTVGGRLEVAEERLAGQLEPLADELRAHPGQAEVSEAVAKIVDAAQNEVTAHIGSLEETVLTLAEALLRPQAREAAAREASRT